jgi:hypothetical protein
MNSNIKAVLLTVLTLSMFTIAIVELTGISNTAIFNRFHKQDPGEELYVPEKASQATDTAGVKPVTRSQKVLEMEKTSMEFSETKFNFGKAKEGQVLKHTFRFKNTGTQPLMIAKTDVTCGCTVTDFPKEPIPPAGEGKLTVQFNTSGKSGIQQKNIIVHSNAVPEAVGISIEADIK